MPGDKKKTQDLSISPARLAKLEAVLQQAAEGKYDVKLPRLDPSDPLALIFELTAKLLQKSKEVAKTAQVIEEESTQIQEGLSKAIASRTEQLERSQAQLQSIVENAPNFIQIVDNDLKVTFINRTDGRDVVGKKVGSFMPPHDRQKARRHLREVLKTGHTTSYEHRGAGRAEDWSWYRTHASPVFNNGNIEGIILMTFDITDDRRRVEALRLGKRAAERARIRDRALLNSIGDGLIVVDEHGQISNVNPAAAQMLGYTEPELIGAWFPATVKILDEKGNEIDQLNRPALRALSTGQAVSETVRYARKDGSSFPAALTISPVVIDGKPVGAIEVFRDLTRERQLEQAKEEFVSLASHQLRTPATGVKAYISMLLDGYAGELSDQQKEFLGKVFETNERQLQIVNDMLNVARVDAGRIIPEIVSTNLTALVKDVIDEQKHAILERKQRVVEELPEEAIEAVVDPKLIRMALENVVSNASKYTREEGQIKVSLGRENSYAVITIADTGVGIAKADLPRLFKRFSRIENPLSAARGGTGLGLYLTQSIVLLHYGRMSVDSSVGKGTTFKVEIPLRAPVVSNTAADVKHNQGAEL